MKCSVFIVWVCCRAKRGGLLQYTAASEAVQPLSISNNSIVYFDDGNRHVHDATSRRVSAALFLEPVGKCVPYV